MKIKNNNKNQKKHYKTTYEVEKRLTLYSEQIQLQNV